MTLAENNIILVPDNMTFEEDPASLADDTVKCWVANLAGDIIKPENTTMNVSKEKPLKKMDTVHMVKDLSKRANDAMKPAGNTGVTRKLHHNALGRIGDDIQVNQASGTVKQADDTVTLADDTVKQADDNVKQADDTVTLADDTVKQADDTVTLADDTVKLADDTVKQADDTVKQADDNVKLADGTVKLTDDAVKLADDTVKSTENTVKQSDHAVKSTDYPVKLTDESVESADQAIKHEKSFRKPIDKFEDMDNTIKLSEEGTRRKRLMRPPLTRTNSEISAIMDKTFSILDILTLAENENVCLDGCNSPEQMKTRLFSTIEQRRRKLQTSNLWNDQRQQRLREENEHKRDALATLFESVSTSLSPGFKHLNNIFKKGEAAADLAHDFHKRTRDLRDGDCNVLITGQTNAGKSTFLNLLLGVDILPKSILSCTSSICKLKFCHSYKVIVVQKDDNRVEMTFDDHSGARTFLENTVAVHQEKSREQGTSFKEVHVLLPAKILKNGITIIDSPGFGENEAMDSVVRDFVIANNVAAFIYVVKTDSSGGVQEDRLIRFLKSVLKIKENNNDESEYFNPKAALFVCNRWDLIEDVYQPRVKENALTKLRGAWPGLEDKQVCFFSSKGSRESEDWDILLQALDDLFHLARQVDITSSYCWLKYIVKECAFFMRTIVYQIQQTERHLHEKLHRATGRLSNLQTDCTTLVKCLKEELKADCDVLRQQLLGYLRSQPMKKEVSQWEVEDIPEFHTQNDHEITKEERDAFIVERIVTILDSSDVTKTFLDEFVTKMQKETQKLGKEMDVITNELKDSNSSLRSSQSSFDSENEATSADSIGDMFVSSASKSFGEKLRLFAESEQSNELALVGISKVIVKATLDTIRRLRMIFNKRMSVEMKDPMAQMSRRAFKISEAMSRDDDILSKLVTRYTIRLERAIESISLCVPRFVRLIDQLMQEIVSVNAETQQTKSDLQNAMEQLEEQKELVRGFGYLHVREFIPEDVVMNIDDPRVSASTVVKVEIDGKVLKEQTKMGTQVLWARFCIGSIWISSAEETITVRYYAHEQPDNQLYKEIAKLKCLSSSSISNFIGMTRIESKAAFIFLDELISAKIYLRRPVNDPTCPYRLQTVVPKLIDELLEGLSHIYRTGLVHMELTAETITVNTSGKVKLSIMGVPRAARFPIDLASVKACDFTCLSPEVLKGELYAKEDDIYSFGLLFAEVVLGDTPFARQRDWPLEEFIKLVDPLSMLTIPQRECFGPLYDIVHGCALPRAQRPCLSELQMLVQDCKLRGFFDMFCAKRTLNSSRPSAIWFMPPTKQTFGM